MMRLITLSLFAFSLLLTSPAAAQNSEKAAARAMAHEGLEHFKAERFAKALDRFSRAHSLVGAPTTGLWKARSLEKVGRWVEATELYLDIAETKLDGDADPRWVKAVDKARNERLALMPRLPKLTIIIEGDGASAAKVSIDGRRVSSALVGVAQPLDPGQHVISAKHASDTAEARVSLAAAEKKEVRLQLRAPTQAAPTPTPAPLAVATPQPSPVAAPTPQAESDGGSSNVGAWVAFGVAGAAAIGTGITGALAAAEEVSLKESCPNGKCESSTDFEAYDALRYTTFGLAGLTGAAAITGVILLVATGDDDADEARSSSVQPIVSPSFVGLQGRF